MKFKDVIKNKKEDVALVIGNGINQYGGADETNSWKSLLASLAKKHGLPLHNGGLPTGVSPTEFYDVLELGRMASAQKGTLQKEFSDLMARWKPHRHHREIVAWASDNNVPILTTNYDNSLATAGNCSLFSIKGKSNFTAFYPWGHYYSNSQLVEPDAGFGIWHINGMQHYSQSIRLGLSHYMGSVERTRNWLHKGSEDRLFGGKDRRQWVGANTWLHIVFNKPLAIFGLALAENEVFLRWLLIERAKYFKKYPERKHAGWYFYTSKREETGKLFFLEQVGITPIAAESYDELYGHGVWVGG